MMRLLFFLSLAFLLLSPNAQAASVGYWNFVSCKTMVDQIPFSFDFFEELDAQSGAPTGKGYAMQTMGDKEKATFKSLTRIEVSTDSSGLTKTVKLYSFGDPDTLFSQFNVDAKKPSQVEIFAVGFGAVWATLSCEPVVID